MVQRSPAKYNRRRRPKRFSKCVTWVIHTKGSFTFTGTPVCGAGALLLLLLLQVVGVTRQDKMTLSFSSTASPPSTTINNSIKQIYINYKHDIHMGKYRIKFYLILPRLTYHKREKHIELHPKAVTVSVTVSLTVSVLKKSIPIRNCKEILTQAQPCTVHQCTCSTNKYIQR